MLKKKWLALSLLMISFFATESGHAQWKWPEKAKNLKVLPENTSAKELQTTMISFAQSLGVRCWYCHVGKEGQPLSEFDFVSDEKPTKETARLMIKMSRAINHDYVAKIDKGGAPHVEVTCLTCHRRNSQPVFLEDVLLETYHAAGLDSMLRQYKATRDDYYGGFTYDFSEGTLNQVADGMTEKAADALKVLQLNAEFYPKSTNTNYKMALLYKALGSNAEAIASAEKVLTIAPNHQGAKKILSELKK